MLTIGKVAKRTGFSPSAIRYYERRGIFWYRDGSRSSKAFNINGSGGKIFGIKGFDFAKGISSVARGVIMSEEKKEKVPKPRSPKPLFPVPEHSPDVDELQRLQKEKKREQDNKGQAG